MTGRRFVSWLVMAALVGAVGLLMWAVMNYRAFQAQRIEVEAVILRASDINALAEAMGCPERGVSGDLVKPLIEQLTACAKAKNAPTWHAPLIR